MKKNSGLLRLALVLTAAALVLGGLCLYAGKAGASAKTESTEAAAVRADTGRRTVPIIMYHSILPDPSRQGDYVVSPSQLESDILYLKAHGYQAVSLDSVISFCEGGGELPEKPVVLTFDDGQLNNLRLALPILKKQGFCGAFSIVGRYAEAACEDASPSVEYSYMDTDDIKDLLSSGIAELVSHSYNMHELGERRGTLQKSTESYTDYRRALLNDTTQAQRFFKKQFGTEPAVYAYPYGLVCPAGRTVIAMLGFKATLGCEEKLNLLLRGSTEGLTEMGRFNRPAGVSTEEFMQRVLPA